MNMNADSFTGNAPPQIENSYAQLIEAMFAAKEGDPAFAQSKAWELEQLMGVPDMSREEALLLRQAGTVASREAMLAVGRVIDEVTRSKGLRLSALLWCFRAVAFNTEAMVGLVERKFVELAFQGEATADCDCCICDFSRQVNKDCAYATATGRKMA